MRTLLTMLTLLAVLAPVIYVLWRMVASATARAVFLRNLTAYFTGLIGYLFIVVFVVAAALLAFDQAFFANNLATLDRLSRAFPMLLLFLIPAVTMAAWADERKTGTDELLFTLPARDSDILIGKYLAVLAVYTVALAFSLTNLIALRYIGNPDWGPIASTYFGYWLAGAALSAIGLLASSLTGSATVAFLLGAALCAIPVFADRLPSTVFAWLGLSGESIASLNSVLGRLSVGENLRDFTLGLVPLSGVAYFVGLAVGALYLNAIVIGRRHWAGERQQLMGLQYLLRAVSVAVVLVSLVALTQAGTGRLDWTAGNLYSLSNLTRQTIGKMDGKRPVLIQAFVSPEVPQEFLPVRKQLLGLLRQYDDLGGGNVTLRVVDVAAFSEAAEEARGFGIEPLSVATERDGRRSVENVYLGVVFTSSYDEVVLPAVGPGTLLEHDLTRALATVSKEERLTVGVLETDAGIIGGGRDWQIVQELRRSYLIEAVSPDAEIDAQKFDVLLAVMPSSLTEPQMTNLIAYVNTGKPVLIFDDPYPIGSNPAGRITTAPRLPKPSPGGMMGQFNRQPPEAKADEGRLTALMRLLKITWTPDAIVWDEYNPYPDIAEVFRPEYLFFKNRLENREAVNTGSPITGGLEDLVALFAGQVQKRADSPYTFTPLLATGPVSGMIPWEGFAEQMPFDMMTMSANSWRLNPDPLYYLDADAHAIAASIRGAEAGQPNVVFVADIDLIADIFFDLRLQNSRFTFDNVAFVLNAVDVLADQTDYLPLRRRRPRPGTLTLVEARTATLKQKQREADKAADESMKTALEKARARFSTRQEVIRADETLSERAKSQQLQIAQANEQLRLATTEAELTRQTDLEKERLSNETRRQVRDIENSYWLRAVLLPPIPAIVLGLFVLLARLLAERRDVDPERRVRA